ncbi:MAG: pSRTUE45c [Actinoallomurus sp.]|nr:pSRTUE45c [Actinoallomurus sp.]
MPDMQSADIEFPDEHTFEMPASWRRVLRRRRGGTPGSPVTIDDQAVEKVRGWTENATARTAQALDHPESDRQLAEDVRTHLGGRATPRGAAMLAHILAETGPDNHTDVDDHAAFADAWVSAHGLSFAAQATAELGDVGAKWWAGSDRPQPQWRCHAGPVDQHAFFRWAWQPVADRLRDLLADADEADYRTAAGALAGHRRTPAQRVIVSYLVPTEKDWVDESCTDGHYLPALRTMLLCSVGSAEQAAAATANRGGLGYSQYSRGVIATLIEVLGTDVTGLMTDAFVSAAASGNRKLAVSVLSRLPTDEAFQLMLDYLEKEHVQPGLLEAMKRYPVRALRLLAETAAGSSPNASSARNLLTGHISANPELTAAVLPDLPPEVRESVVQLLDEAQAEKPERVEEAPADVLPPLLADPPWTRRRKAAKPIVITGLEPPSEPAITWAKDSREEWSRAASEYSHLRDDDWPAMIRRYQAGQLNFLEEVGLFTNSPEDLTRPLVTNWRPTRLWGEWMKKVVVRYELDALPTVLDIAAKETPSIWGELLLPFFDVRAARLMADWLARLKSVRKTATTWFAWHGVPAVRLLVPDAVGEVGRERTGAEVALRHVASVHGDEAVMEVAREYGGQAATAVAALLAADPLENLPARLPKVGDWLDLSQLPQALLAGRAQALPLEAAGHVLTMLSISKPGEEYAGLEIVRETCDRASLAEFGWAVFRQWQLGGMPAKDGWALTALGWIGDDGTVRRLTPVIRAWPGEGGHSKAVTGLDVLAAIGTEIALVHLNGIAQRIKFKALKDRAREKIKEVAEGLGLSREQLADRLVPDFGLDEDGSMVLDYGPRRFVVGFDEQLKPYVLDEHGKRRKDLPAPGARDDAEQAPAARKRFADLKKDVRTVAGDLIRRLEAAMVARRGWSVAEFTDLFVRHPLTWHVARRLVWLSDGTAFRVAEDRTLADVEDRALTLSDTARITIAHPLELAGALAAWAEVFADYEILQPFPQLGRPVYALTEEERAASQLTRFEGVTVPTGKVLGLERHGWVREYPQDAGIQGLISRPAGEGWFIVIHLDPGIAVGYADEFAEQELAAIWIADNPDGYRRRDDEDPLRFGVLDPVMASEVIAALTELTS